MSRVTRSPNSYDHRIKREREDEFVISWMVDFKYAGSRLRYPRRVVRDTNKKGAERFAKKWGIPMPPEPTR